MAINQYAKKVKVIIQKEKTFLGKIKAVGHIMNGANLLLQRKLGVSLPITIGTPIDSLYNPEGLARLDMIRIIHEKKNIRYLTQDRKINIFIPNISKDLIFGGYISLYNFIKRLIENDYKIRLIICEQVFKSNDALRKEFEDSSVVWFCLQNSEIEHWSQIEDIEFGLDDINIGYSWVTMNYASKVAQGTSNLPLFFIQEYESIFYEYNSFRALCDETYSLPHKAIFNSKFLRQFFHEKRIGVFQDNIESKNCIHFEHTFANLDKPDTQVLSDRTKKKLLFYARPENHASRNLFELGTYALEKAIEEGVFDESWEFYGVGSLKPIQKIALGKGHYLEMMPRVSFDEYKKMLMEFDIGLCPMYAPHPSVPPFEMASAGLVSITTTFENRSKEDMEAISGNIVACEPKLSDLVKALETAKEKSNEYENRVTNSQFEWPRKWEDSFSDAFMQEFKNLINDEQ